MRSVRDIAAGSSAVIVLRPQRQSVTHSLDAMAWRTVGSLPISSAIPTIANDSIPQSHKTISSGVPTNADVVICSGVSPIPPNRGGNLLLCR